MERSIAHQFVCVRVSCCRRCFVHYIVIVAGFSSDSHCGCCTLERKMFTQMWGSHVIRHYMFLWGLCLMSMFMFGMWVPIARIDALVTIGVIIYLFAADARFVQTVNVFSQFMLGYSSATQFSSSHSTHHDHNLCCISSTQKLCTTICTLFSVQSTYNPHKLTATFEYHPTLQANPTSTRSATLAPIGSSAPSYRPSAARANR